jgi:hypothetical protein
MSVAFRGLAGSFMAFFGLGSAGEVTFYGPVEEKEDRR